MSNEMAIDFQYWNRTFPDQRPYNDGHWFGVEFDIHEKPSHPVLGIHRFNDAEVANERRVWFDVLGRDGQRAQDVANKYVVGLCGRGWLGYLHLGGRDGEPGGFFDIPPGQEYTVWLADKRYNQLSQEVKGLISYITDLDPKDQVYLPSYYIVFEEVDDE